MNRPFVVVSAGSYHLPFNRLVDWMEPWAEKNPQVRVLMQHGPGRPMRGAENRAILPYPELIANCVSATVVVLQGGAGGVMDMRGIGRIPIVVPRVPIDDEVVDDHQLLFSEKAAEMGVIHRAAEREQLWALLDDALNGGLQTHAVETSPTPGVANAIQALQELPPPLILLAKARRLMRTVVGLLLRR